MTTWTIRRLLPSEVMRSRGCVACEADARYEARNSLNETRHYCETCKTEVEPVSEGVSA